MMNRNSYRNVFSVLVAIGMCFFAAQASHAVTIGPGAGLGGGGADGGGNRLNVSDTGVMLLAGTYDVEDFAYNTHTVAGALQPFLGTASGANSYATIWFTPYAPTAGSGNVESQVYAPGTQQFTLAADTMVFAGFNVQGPAVNFTGGGSTDHANPDQPIGSLGQVVGNGGHNNLGRSYNFEINVRPAQAGNGVPEPATATLALLGLGGLMMRRKRTA